MNPNPPTPTTLANPTGKRSPAATRQLLLEHGLALARQKGLRGLTVREVAAAAGVNLGSFVYHFGNRDAFIAELVELWYAPMLAQLTLSAQGAAHDSALTRLHATLARLLKIVAANATFARHLLMDAMAGEAALRPFMQQLPMRHPQLILQLIMAAQQEGSLIAAPPFELMAFLMMSSGLPLVLASSLQGDWLPPQAQMLQILMADPAQAEQRLQWALQGITTREFA